MRPAHWCSTERERETTAADTIAQRARAHAGCRAHWRGPGGAKGQGRAGGDRGDGGDGAGERQRQRHCCCFLPLLSFLFVFSLYLCILCSARSKRRSLWRPIKEFMAAEEKRGRRREAREKRASDLNPDQSVSPFPLPLSLSLPTPTFTPTATATPNPNPSPSPARGSACGAAALPGVRAGSLLLPAGRLAAAEGGAGRVDAETALEACGTDALNRPNGHAAEGTRRSGGREGEGGQTAARGSKEVREREKEGVRGGKQPHLLRARTGCGRAACAVYQPQQQQHVRCARGRRRREPQEGRRGGEAADPMMRLLQSLTPVIQRRSSSSTSLFRALRPTPAAAGCRAPVRCGLPPLPAAVQSRRRRCSLPPTESNQHMYRWRRRNPFSVIQRQRGCSSFLSRRSFSSPLLLSFRRATCTLHPPRGRITTATRIRSISKNKGRPIPCCDRKGAAQGSESLFSLLSHLSLLRPRIPCGACVVAPV